MSDQQLTDWFPGYVKPVRPGVYETDSNGAKTPCYQFWNGEFWGMASNSPIMAKSYAWTVSMFQDDKWRGLAFDPNFKADDSQTDDHTGICEVTE